jgi:hypothetical protein
MGDVRERMADAHKRMAEYFRLITAIPEVMANPRTRMAVIYNRMEETRRLMAVVHELMGATHRPQDVIPSL